MKNELTQTQIDSYRQNGFIIIEDFLDAAELQDWREAMDNAVKKRGGRKFPHSGVRTGEEDGINKDAKYFGKVFHQIINLWQTDDRMRKIMLDERLGKMATQLAQVDGIRIWHDQSLVKPPWANPTAWHLDTPFWSFTHREALSIWVALDDVTVENGCLYFMPGSHKVTRFDEPGISANMGEIFEDYPEYFAVEPVKSVIKAGSCSFHNGLCIHAAGANMTTGYRRAMTCAYMPDGATFNGKQNVLSDAQFAKLKVGDLLNDDSQNPLIYHKDWER